MTAETSSKADIRAHRMLTFWGALLALSTILIHTPAAIYTGNSEDFVFGLWPMLFGGLSALAVTVTACLIPLVVLRGQWLTAYSATWSVLGLLVWLSSNLLILDMGVLDGRAVEIIIPTQFAAVSTVALTASGLIALLTAVRVPKDAIRALAALNLVLAVLFSVQVLQDRPTKTAPDLGSADALFRFSTDKNALVILLDTFQADLLFDLLQERPSYRKKLDGFVFYRNATSVSTTTYAAMPTIHSGRQYLPEDNLKSLYRERVEKGSFLGALAEANYEVSLNPYNSVCPKGGVFCVAAEKILNSPRVVLHRQSIRLLDLALLRAAPFFLKNLMFNGGAGRLHPIVGPASYRPDLPGVGLLDVLSTHAFADGRRPTAKFLHVLTTHPPVKVDSRCKPLPRPARVTRKGLAAQSGCAMEELFGVFDHLKHIGVYDNTLIMVIADHGAGLPSSFVSESPSTPWAALAGTANPVFLIKQANLRGSLQISDIAVDVGDVAATVCTELNACEGFPGYNPAHAPTERIRYHNSYDWSRFSHTSEKLLDVRRFRVMGPVWERSSWSRTNAPMLAARSPLQFGNNESVNQFLDWGWGPAGPKGVWTVGPEATLSLGLPANRSDSPITLRASIWALVRPQRPEMKVRVSGNGRELTTWSFRHPKAVTTKDVVVDSSILDQDGYLNLSFLIDSPRSPLSLGMGEDKRPLGLFFYSLSWRGVEN